ncbi:hypothetical protein PIB30_000126 [Stylosanthes scabra]|uniref:Uncharacterized protein n=1 Tax=Stylosanthes scabra TaxID=79078 RepID=A0ABU6R4G5_9FABA|nr:hypothetical protein [Stylosanthes scabra]
MRLSYKVAVVGFQDSSSVQAIFVTAAFRQNYSQAQASGHVVSWLNLTDKIASDLVVEGSAFVVAATAAAAPEILTGETRPKTAKWRKEQLDSADMAEVWRGAVMQLQSNRHSPVTDGLYRSLGRDVLGFQRRQAR